MLPDTERLKRGRAAVIDCRILECGVCVAACGFSAVSLFDGVIRSDPDRCVGCGGCAAACPEKRIILVKDRSDGTWEITYAAEGVLPEIGDNAVFRGAEARVLQVIPKRTENGSALIRAAACDNELKGLLK